MQRAAAAGAACARVFLFPSYPMHSCMYAPAVAPEQVGARCRRHRQQQHQRGVQLAARWRHAAEKDEVRSGRKPQTRCVRALPLKRGIPTAPCLSYRVSAIGDDLNLCHRVGKESQMVNSAIHASSEDSLCHQSSDACQRGGVRMKQFCCGSILHFVFPHKTGQLRAPRPM